MFIVLCCVGCLVLWYIEVFVGFETESYCVYPWPVWNSLCRPAWPRSQRSTSASQVLGPKVRTAMPGDCIEFCYVVSAVFCVVVYCVCHCTLLGQVQTKAVRDDYGKGNSWICTREAESPFQASLTSLLFLTLTTLPLEPGLLPQKATTMTF